MWLLGEMAMLTVIRVGIWRIVEKWRLTDERLWVYSVRSLHCFEDVSLSLLLDVMLVELMCARNHFTYTLMVVWST
jgi:hypothetical protein